MYVHIYLYIYTHAHFPLQATCLRLIAKAYLEIGGEENITLALNSVGKYLMNIRRYPNFLLLALFS